jgi:hypothetical protein
MVDRDIVFDLKKESVEIFNDAICSLDGRVSGNK